MFGTHCSADSKPRPICKARGYRHGQRPRQLEGLKDDTDIAATPGGQLILRHPMDRVSRDMDLAGSRAVDARQQVDQCCLKLPDLPMTATHSATQYVTGALWSILWWIESATELCRRRN
jgi:hypothetical protein